MHAFDPTPRALSRVAGQDMPAGFHMNGVALGTEDGVARFYKPKDPRHVSHSIARHDRVSNDILEVPQRTLRTLMSERGHSHLDVLKLDIEGAEYEVLEQLCAQDIACRQLLIEFHHHLHAFPYARARAAVAQLNSHGYEVFHIAGNGREVSLIRPHFNE